MSHQGRCLCGACRFTATPDVQEAGVCHCSMCRKWTGGINMAVHCNDVIWNEGAPVKTYASSSWAERGFCATCGSNLFWSMPGWPDSEKVISLMAFDAPEQFLVTRQIFIDEKPDTYALAGDIPALTAAEVMATAASPTEGHA